MSKEHIRVGTFCEKCRQVMCKCVSNKKQTAVEFLYGEMASILNYEVDPVTALKIFDIYKKAKEMEKEQIVDAFDFGIASVINKYDKAFSEIDGDEYYEEKYQK